MVVVGIPRMSRFVTNHMTRETTSGNQDEGKHLKNVLEGTPRCSRSPHVHVLFLSAEEYEQMASENKKNTKRGVWWQRSPPKIQKYKKQKRKIK